MYLQKTRISKDLIMCPYKLQNFCSRVGSNSGTSREGQEGSCPRQRFVNRGPLSGPPTSEPSKIDPSTYSFVAESSRYCENRNCSCNSSLYQVLSFKRITIVVRERCRVTTILIRFYFIFHVRFVYQSAADWLSNKKNEFSRVVTHLYTARK